MIEVALDFDLVGQLTLHAIFLYGAFRDNLQSDDDFAELVLGLIHIAEFALSKEFADLEALTDGGVGRSEQILLFGEILLLRRFGELDWAAGFCFLGFEQGLALRLRCARGVLVLSFLLDLIRRYNVAVPDFLRHLPDCEGELGLDVLDGFVDVLGLIHDPLPVRINIQHKVDLVLGEHFE